jgi:hypothetical protein
MGLYALRRFGAPAKLRSFLMFRFSQDVELRVLLTRTGPCPSGVGLAVRCGTVTASVRGADEEEVSTIYLPNSTLNSVPGDGASFTTIYAGHFLDILISAVRCGASICPDVSVSQEAGVSRKTQEAISTCQIELCRD